MIGSLLADGVRAPTPDEIHRYVAQERVLQDPHVYRLAARQRLVSATAVYFRFLLPAREWVFVVAEARVPGAILDLLFERDDGALRADEIKTGTANDLANGADLARQIAAQLSGGLAHFGPRFVGVRACLLGAPRRSFTLTADGERQPIEVSS